MQSLAVDITVRWVAVALLLIGGCGNEEETDTEPVDSETGGPDGGHPDSENPDGGANGPDGGAWDGAQCVSLDLNLHVGDGQAMVVLETMTVTNTATDVYDFAMVNQMPEPPAVFLGPGVTAVNLGADASFAAVVEAPADGYDADGDTPVIGTDWRTGGNGTDGHIVSGNVYVLKTADGRYGKISITSAKQGKATIDAYLQLDGSADLECASAR